MNEKARSTLTGVGFALLAFGIFSTHDVFVKLLGETYAPFQIIFFSVLLSFPLATLMIMRDTREGNLRPVHPWWMALRSFANVLTGFSAFYAFSVLPLAQTYAILFAAPLLITVLAIPILGERVGWQRWLAVLVGLCGVLIVLQPGGAPLELGHLAAMVAAIGSATASVIVRKIGREERSAVLMLYPMITTFIVMLCMLPIVYKPMPLEHLGMIAIVSFFGFSAGLCVIAAYRAADAALIAPMQYSQIIWAAVFGALIFNEYPERTTWIGAGVIILSGLFIVFREATSSASENTPVLRTRSRHEFGTFPRIGTYLRRWRKPTQKPPKD